MKIKEMFKIWRIISLAHEISVTKDEKVNFYDKEKKLLMEVPLSIFEKFQKVTGKENVV